MSLYWSRWLPLSIAAALAGCAAPIGEVRTMAPLVTLDSTRTPERVVECVQDRLDTVPGFKVQRRDVRGQTIRLVISAPALFGPDYATVDLAAEPRDQGGSRVSIRASGVYGGGSWARQIKPHVEACTTE